MAKNSILVSGGAGYIGSHVVRASLAWERKIAARDPSAYWPA